MKMKFFLPIAAVALFLGSCGGGKHDHKHGDSTAKKDDCEHDGAQTEPDANGFYGVAFDDTKAVDFEKALADFQKTSDTSVVVVNGEIAEVCQDQGCWMSAKTKDASIMLAFNNKFLVPKDSKGKFAASGHFYTKTISVEKQKHQAEEQGKSKEEIAKITEPKVKTMFKTTGVKFTK